MSTNSNHIQPCSFDGHPLSDYQGKPFPFHVLPKEMQDYVFFISGAFRVDPSAVALACLTLLCNTLAHSAFLPGPDGHHTSTCLSTCISVPNAQRLTLAIERMMVPMLAIQSTRIQEAASRNSMDYQAMRDEPYPFSARTSEVSRAEFEAELVKKILTLMYPMFVAQSPYVTNLTRHIAMSADYSISVVADHLLYELVFPFGKRQHQQREIYCSLVQEGFIEIPTRWRRSSQPMVRAHVGMLLPSSQDVLDYAANQPLGTVAEIVGKCILYRGSEYDDSSADAIGRDKSELWWSDAIESCLLTRSVSRRRPEFRAFEYDQSSEIWHKPLVKTEYNRSLFGKHAPLFLDLPRKIAATLLVFPEQLHEVGAWPYEIAKWMMAQTLLVTVPARRQTPTHPQNLREMIMLDKIRKMQPVKFWRLRRSYNRQSREQHEHALDSLLKQGLVRYNEKGELEVVS